MSWAWSWATPWSDEFLSNVSTLFFNRSWIAYVATLHSWAQPFQEIQASSKNKLFELKE